MLLLPAPGNLSPLAWSTAAVASLMALWWLTEAIPIPATALIPLLLFPLLEIQPSAPTASAYAHPIIFLFLGGFIMAQAIENCGLHKRIALKMLSITGHQPKYQVAGFMLITALISMWVSNTATMVMMYPMVLSVIDSHPDQAKDHHLPIALLLGTAYAANIGGMGTLIGTPPNALLAGFMAETYDVTLGFGQWLLLGVPLVLISLPIAWFLLTHILFPLPHQSLPKKRYSFAQKAQALGPISSREIMVALVVAATALAWILRPLLAKFIPGINDTSIAIAGALSMFLLPQRKQHDEANFSWETAERLPWSVLILFGGGLSLASAINQSGLAAWIGNQLLMVGTLPLLLITLCLTAIMLLLTELTSNTATTAVFLPIVGSIALGIGIDPLLLTLPAALAASCAFMMPVATPPNAIAFGTGRLAMGHMIRAGLWLNIVMLFLINLAVLTFATKLFS